MIVSTFLPLGPCGQGGFALIALVSPTSHPSLIKYLSLSLHSQGQVAVKLFPKLAAANPDRPGINELAMLGPALLGSGLMTGLLLWG